MRALWWLGRSGPPGSSAGTGLRLPQGGSTPNTVPQRTDSSPPNESVGRADVSSTPEAMIEEVLHRREMTVVRRLRLAPGEATRWHTDPHHRVTVVMSGDALAIEYRDGGEPKRVTVTAGTTDWDEPASRVHRAVNVGVQPYEEVVVCFLESPEAVPQPNTE